MCEYRWLDALALRAVSEARSGIVVEFHNQASHANQPTTCRTGVVASGDHPNLNQAAPWPLWPLYSSGEVVKFSFPLGVGSTPMVGVGVTKMRFGRHELL